MKFLGEYEYWYIVTIVENYSEKFVSSIREMILIFRKFKLLIFVVLRWYFYSSILYCKI